jgi:hypothetical protein
VPLDPHLRNRIRNDRRQWPFKVQDESASPPLVFYLGRNWHLASLEGIAAAELGEDWYDGVCERAGRSPRPRVDFVLVDLVGGRPTEFRNVARDGQTLVAEREAE